ncbi:hypothetical protein [Hwangdonia lutea]|uniref:Uncharacterized protein n=1 Tax=Hwangdonia lutea TaxID=3075823 RepID=A0AA97EN65_9FLAO|nr:hypothetical protein [Hwangdonia sp. SCSIO 19198]WOD43520.1 hypothetical protein RNZ46_16145 [Hwangdonia sp. SCSIO 19198]
MKILIFIIILSITFHGHSQYKLKNKVAKKKLASTTLVNKSLPLKSVKEKTLKRGQKFSDIPLVNFPEKKLKLRASKSWRITPQRPSIPGLSFEFDGTYSRESFSLGARHIHTAATSSGYLYRTYSGFIKYTTQRGGEYRMKISLVNDNFPGDIFEPERYMLIQLGDREIRTSLNDVRNREVNIAFSTQNAGIIRIGISGVNPDREKPSHLSVSAIQIDKI